MTVVGAQFRSFGKVIRQYFRFYGGWSSVLSSPLFLFSVAIAVLDYKAAFDGEWVEKTFLLIPSLLGFSLGTYAILFSLVGARLKSALKIVNNEKGISYFDEINSTFFHFIFVKVICIVVATIYSGDAIHDILLYLHNRGFFDFLSISILASLYNILSLMASFIGSILLVYSVVLVISAALMVYRLARIVDPKGE